MIQGSPGEARYLGQTVLRESMMEEALREQLQEGRRLTPWRCVVQPCHGTRQHL